MISATSIADKLPLKALGAIRMFIFELQVKKRFLKDYL